jgi:hypothetical protein
MGLLRWLAARSPNMPLHRVSSLVADEQGVCFVRVNGAHETVSWGQINRVVVRTTDKGPFDDDVYFVLETATDTLVIPQPAKGSYELLCYLEQLPRSRQQVCKRDQAGTLSLRFFCRTPLT